MGFLVLVPLLQSRKLKLSTMKGSSQVRRSSKRFIWNWNHFPQRQSWCFGCSDVFYTKLFCEYNWNFKHFLEANLTKHYKSVYHAQVRSGRLTTWPQTQDCLTPALHPCSCPLVHTQVCLNTHGASVFLSSPFKKLHNLTYCSHMAMIILITI